MYEIHFVFNGDRRPVYVDECRRCPPINHLVINGHRSALKKKFWAKKKYTTRTRQQQQKRKKAITFERQLANRISIVGIKKKGKLPFEKK